MTQLNKTKIFQEVNSYQVLRFQDQLIAQLQLTEKIKAEALLADSNLDTEVKKIEVEQKIFQGFQGYNSFKKSELEIEQASLELKNTMQDTILEAVKAYADLSLKIKNIKFNNENTDLFERQVESDNSRLQKGEITLSDLAQAGVFFSKGKS